MTIASATESEHYSLCEATMYNIWLRDMLRSLRVDQPTIIHQDNNAAITMIDSNCVDFWRHKHWLVRRNYIREEVENKECKLKYTPTEDMIADMGKNFENIYGRNRNASDELMIQRITNKTLM